MIVIVYKVVGPEFESTMALPSHRRYYELGQETKPVRGTPLFAYADLESAVEDAYSPGLHVFKCEADVSVKFRIPPNFSFLHASEPDWGDWQHRRYDCSGSLGYLNGVHSWVLCESLTPVEDVTAQAAAQRKRTHE